MIATVTRLQFYSHAGDEGNVLDVGTRDYCVLCLEKRKKNHRENISTTKTF